MKFLKKIIVTLLIASMIFTLPSFTIFADTYTEIVFQETSEEEITSVEESASEVEIISVEVTDSVESISDILDEETTITIESIDPVGASYASPSDKEIIYIATASDIDDEEFKNDNYAEEPEEDETTSVREYNDIEESTITYLVSDDDVGASYASPNTATDSDANFTSDIIEEEIATKSFIEKIQEIELATISQMNLLGDTPLFGVGETYWFGTYPQNDGNAKQLEPIPWRLTNIETDGTALFTTFSLVHPGPFNNEIDVNATWRDCDLRNWLNDDFFNKAFSTNQKNSDLFVDKEADTDGEIYSLGKVFLLDIDQVNTYLSNYLDRIIYPTEWATTIEGGIDNLWWLRNRAGDRDWGKVAFVDYEGEIRNTDGNNMNRGTLGIRPALYLKTSSSMYKPGSLTWDLDGASFKNESRLWNDMNNYFGGQKLPTAVNINPPAGKEFRGWKINNSNILYTEIPANQTGDITLKPVWDTLSLKYYDRYFGTDLTTYFETFNPELVNRPNGKFPYEADYNSGEIIEDFYIRQLVYKDSQGNYLDIPYNGDISIQNHIVYVIGNRGILPPYMRLIDSIELNTSRVKKSYTEGDALNVSGLVIKVTMYNGQEIYVTYSEEMSQYFTITPSNGQSLSTNNRVVTVEFGGISSTYNISVNKRGGGYVSGGGGSGGGGGGVIKPIQEMIFRNPIILNTTIQTNKTIRKTVNMSDSKWIKDESTGKWMLMTKEVDGRSVVMADGFYDTISYENGKTKVDTYYFSAAGELVTGWVETIDTNKYFFEVDYNANEGKMVKGWKVIEGKWYFFGDDGAMYRYTITPDGYLVDANGEYVGQLATN